MYRFLIEIFRRRKLSKLKNRFHKYKYSFEYLKETDEYVLLFPKYNPFYFDGNITYKYLENFFQNLLLKNNIK